MLYTYTDTYFVDPVVIFLIPLISTPHINLHMQPLNWPYYIKAKVLYELNLLYFSVRQLKNSKYFPITVLNFVFFHIKHIKKQTKKALKILI